MIHIKELNQNLINRYRRHRLNCLNARFMTALNKWSWSNIRTSYLNLLETYQVLPWYNLPRINLVIHKGNKISDTFRTEEV